MRLRFQVVVLGLKTCNKNSEKTRVNQISCHTCCEGQEVAYAKGSLSAQHPFERIPKLDACCVFSHLRPSLRDRDFSTGAGMLGLAAKLVHMLCCAPS